MGRVSRVSGVRLGFSRKICILFGLQIQRGGYDQVIVLKLSWKAHCQQKK